MKTVSVLLGTILLTASTLAAAADETNIRLPSVFGDHMVLQQGQPLPVWGWTRPDCRVTVSIAGRKKSCMADREGAWRLTIGALKAGGPHEMTVTGDEEIVLHDVLVGEVWIGSGQSNMEWPLTRSADSQREIAAADYPEIRLLQVPHRLSAVPNPDVRASWQKCSPETAGRFSAVLYHFGRELHSKLSVPVGLIHPSWGASRIDPWTPPCGVAAVPELAGSMKQIRQAHEKYLSAVEAAANRADEEQRATLNDWLKAARAAVKKHAQLTSLAPGVDEAHPLAGWSAPGSMYHAMIHPFVPFGVKGAVWYQGEANRTDGLLYRDKMRALIEGWRKVWDQDSFSFYWVQIAPFNYDGDPYDLPRLWEAQTATMAIPATGMAVITDIGNLKNIHPGNKREVGRRLSLWALAKDYGRDVVYSGPIFRKAVVRDGKVRIMFDHVGSGLASRDGNKLDWFEILTPTSAVPARARIVPASESGLKEDTVLAWSDEVDDPLGVRFAWHELAEPNLINREGLVANSFRTVSEKPVIEGKRLFLDHTEVSLSCPQKNGAIRYTLDGSVPTASSTKYSGPLRLDSSAEVKARFFRGDGCESMVAAARFEKVEPRPYGDKRFVQGVRFEYYEAQMGNSLPDFNTMTPTASGTIDEFSLSRAERSDHFAMRFSGYFDVSEAGNYTFQLCSDAGSRLFVDDGVVVDHDGLHGMRIVKEGSVELEEGLHGLRVTFFEAAGNEGLKVLYSGPDSPEPGAPQVWCEQ